MRFLTYDNRANLSVTRDFSDDDVPPYAILSHTWGSDDDEVTLQDIRSELHQPKSGYRKIKFCGQQARRDGYQHFWVDTCCIDKANHTELSRAITSMYRWYQHAQVCYVYLADVTSRPGEDGKPTDHSWETSFRRSRWFTRGWTLQELLAPWSVVFYTSDGGCLGTKRELKELLHDITRIPTAALDGQPLSQFPIIERMRWTFGRRTKEKEDQAYCLLGIFDVHMYLNYGEGDHAFSRLQKEIDAQISSQEAAHVRDQPSRIQHGVKALGLCLASAPLTPPDQFVGREAEIEAIHHIIRPEKATLEQQRLVLGGMGGMGKTQLAIAYARRYKNCYASVFWLNATSEMTLHASLRLLAPSIGINGRSEQIDNEQILAQVHVWLSNTYDWLLIFDNLDNPDQFDLDGFCPQIGHGSILVTTRLPEKLPGSKIQVQPLIAINDSIDILQIRSGRKDAKHDVGARRLAHRMEGLPLALVTAGAFLRKNTLSFQQYLDAYEQRWQVDHRSCLQEYKDRTLYTTWNLTYDQLTTNDFEAAQMLKLLAYFDLQQIWYQLFRAGLPDPPPKWLPACLADRIDFESVMGTLVDYGLIKVQRTGSSNDTFGIHGCVHDWILVALNAEIDTCLYWYAFDCVAAGVPMDFHVELKHVAYTQLSRHAAHLTHHRFEQHSHLDCGLSQRLDKTDRIAALLKEQEQFSVAKSMNVRVLAEKEKTLGPRNLSTLQTIIHLAQVYYHQHNLDEAERLYVRVLVEGERLLNDFITPNTIHNLGLIYRHRGKIIEAEQMLEQALIIYERIFEPDHIVILKATEHLGVIYVDQHRFDKAEETFLRALAGYQKTIGPEHLSTLSAVRWLGLLYHAQGRFIEAEQMIKRALIGRKKILGSEHPSTLDTFMDLDLIYLDQGQLVDAREVYRRFLDAHGGGGVNDQVRCMASILGFTLYRAVYVEENDRVAARISLGQWVRHEERWAGDIRSVLPRLARALTHISEDEDASIAYFHCLAYSNGMAEFQGLVCDGCEDKTTIAKGRWVCRQCPNMDLCHDCMGKYLLGDLSLGTCSDHEYSDVGSLVTQILAMPSQGAKEMTLDVWLVQLREKYQT